MKVGQIQKLKVARISDYGLYLVDEEQNEVLLPNRYVSLSDHEGDEKEVFVYHDSEDRLVATTETPTIKEGEVAYLKVCLCHIGITGLLQHMLHTVLNILYMDGFPLHLLLKIRSNSECQQSDNFFIVYLLRCIKCFRNRLRYFFEIKIYNRPITFYYTNHVFNSFPSSLFFLSNPTTSI